MHHPREEMRQIDRKGMKKWRCIKSIQAVKKDVAARDAFGLSVTAVNSAEARTRMNARINAERATLTK
jgi:hypothetical protein